MAEGHVIDAVCKLAGRRAVRHSLAEFGCDGAELLQVQSEPDNVYHVAPLRRLVWIAAVILPRRPPALTAAQAAWLLAKATALEAEPWQASVLLRPTFLPRAVVWCRLSGRGGEAPANSDPLYASAERQ
jgi:hypothetical protein